jgi:hypothetical protein
LQVLGEAVQQTKSLDQDKIADYICSHTFKTVIGDVEFGNKGEWKKAADDCVVSEHCRHQYRRLPRRQGRSGSDQYST